VCPDYMLQNCLRGKPRTRSQHRAHGVQETVILHSAFAAAAASLSFVINRSSSSVVSASALFQVEQLGTTGPDTQQRHFTHVISDRSQHNWQMITRMKVH